MKILEGFKKRLKDIAESYERHSHGTEILFSAAPLKAEKVPSTEEYLMPPVIVWDPLLQRSDIFDLRFILSSRKPRYSTFIAGIQEMERWAF